MRLEPPTREGADDKERRRSARDFGTWSGEIQVRGTTPGTVDPPSPCRVEDDFAFEPTWNDGMCARGTDTGLAVAPASEAEFVDLCEGETYAWVDGRAGEIVLVLNRLSR